MQTGGRRAAVRDREPDQDVVGRCLRVLRRHVPVPIAVKHPGVGQLVLRFAPAAPAVFLAERFIREFRVRVLIERLEIRVGRCGVDVEVNFFDVLRVVALRVREAE